MNLMAMRRNATVLVSVVLIISVWDSKKTKFIVTATQPDVYGVKTIAKMTKIVKSTNHLPAPSSPTVVVWIVQGSWAVGSSMLVHARILQVKNVFEQGMLFENYSVS